MLTSARSARTFLMAALGAVFGAALLIGAPAAHADKCDDQAAGDGKGKGKNFHVEVINGKKVHVIDTVIAVCGKVPRPSVVYVLQAKTINYEWENLKQDFLPLIIATVKKAPF